MDSKRPKTIPDAIKAYAEIHAPAGTTKGYKLGTKNARKLERIRLLSKQMRGVRVITIRVVLMILAVICLFLAAINVQTPRGNLMAAGLCLWALATIITA